MLEEGRVANLASRALGLSLRRLARDMRDAHGHPVLLAETFVAPSRFAGTCYRASNWVSLGRTRGYSREPGGSARWRENGRPKEVLVYEMEKDASAALCRGELPGDWRAGAGAAPPSAPELRSLHAFLEDMPDFRKARGRRYGLACYVTIMIAARLAGYRGVTAFGEFGAVAYLPPPPTGTTLPGRRRPSTRSWPHRPAERRVPPKAPPRCATPGEQPRPQADKTPRILPGNPDDPPTSRIHVPRQPAEADPRLDGSADHLKIRTFEWA